MKDNKLRGIDFARCLFFMAMAGAEAKGPGGSHRWASEFVSFAVENDCGWNSPAIQSLRSIRYRFGRDNERLPVRVPGTCA